jgi:excisionase family DNA binding protein
MINGSTPQPPFGPLSSTLSLEEAAALLGVTTEGLMRYIRAGELPHLRVPGGDTVEFRVLPTDVHDLRARLASADPAPEVETGTVGLAIQVGADPFQPLDEGRAERAGALARLIDEHNRVLAENERLQETLRLQSARIAELEASGAAARPKDTDGDAALPDWVGRLRSLPAAMEELAGQVQALQEELALLRERREQTDQGAFQQAWRRIQRRPWWADLLD